MISRERYCLWYLASSLGVVSSGAILPVYLENNLALEI